MSDAIDIVLDSARPRRRDGHCGPVVQNSWIAPKIVAPQNVMNTEDSINASNNMIASIVYSLLCFTLPRHCRLSCCFFRSIVTVRVPPRQETRSPPFSKCCCRSRPATALSILSCSLRCCLVMMTSVVIPLLYYMYLRFA